MILKVANYVYNATNIISLKANLQDEHDMKQNEKKFIRGFYFIGPVDEF